MNNLLKLLALSCLYIPQAWAQITVSEPWVRATVPQQKSTGAFMQIASAADARLISVSSPVAQAEIHEMSMQGDVMRMRQIAGLDIPANKPVQLKPGSYHLMLVGLTKPIAEGDSVPLTLVFVGKDKKRQTVEVQAPAKALTTPTSAPAKGHEHHHHH